LYQFGYDPEDRLVSITDQFGNQMVIERDGVGIPTAVISPHSIRTELVIDANNHLTDVLYPDGSVYAFTYAADGLMTLETEPNGNTFAHVFDSNGRVTDVTDDEGGHWQFLQGRNTENKNISQVMTGEGATTTYDDQTSGSGVYVSRISGPSGDSTEYAQSNDGLEVEKSLPCGMNLRFDYEIASHYGFKYVSQMEEDTLSGKIRTTTFLRTDEDTNGDDEPDLNTEIARINGSRRFTFVNDVLQSKMTYSTGTGKTMDVFYDPTTLSTTKISIPNLHDTDYTYYADGNLETIESGTRLTTFTYNTQGWPEYITDPETLTTHYTYDPVGRITEIERPDGSTLGFTYDANGNMTLLTNPASITHGFDYNGVNLNSTYQTPLSGTYSYVYNKDRQLKEINFPSGKQIVNVYSLGRLDQTQTNEGNIDYSYLCDTKIDTISNGADSITYEYEDNGPLLRSQTLTGTLNQSVIYTHDDYFEVTEKSYAGAVQDIYYASDGLVYRVYPFWITRDYYTGLPKRVSGSGLDLRRSFNAYGEVYNEKYKVSRSYVEKWTLTLNDAGRITHKNEETEGVDTDYDYTYDLLGRLLTVTKDGNLVEEYQYGPNGSRTYEMNTLRGIPGRWFTFSDEDHLLTADTVTYEYDLDGFLERRIDGLDVTEYDYSSRGELQSVTLPDGTVIAYVQDPLGRRIAKSVDGVITEKYLWEGQTRLLAVYDGSDNLLMRFEYVDARTPARMTKNGTTYYFGYDQVGTLKVVADTSGTVVKNIEYDTFGNIITDSDPAFTVPFGFAGGLHDRDTGLVRFGYRDYDPDVARWTAKDPIGFAGGDTDLYGYCLSDPVDFADPNGLAIVQVAGTVIGMGISIVSNYGDFSSGRISGTDYALSIGLGALTGLASTLGGGLITGALWGGGAAMVNNAGNQMMRLDSPCGDSDFDPGQMLKAGGFGFFGGILSGVGYKTGHQVLRNKPVAGDVSLLGPVGGARLPVGRAPNYGEVGGLLGNVLGTAFAN
jgi:RHS repeat-associated protein